MKYSNCYFFKVQEAVKRATEELAKAAFTSEGSELSSLPTNSLLVHLGLIKSEVWKEDSRRNKFASCWTLMKQEGIVTNSFHDI